MTGAVIASATKPNGVPHPRSARGDRERAGTRPRRAETARAAGDSPVGDKPRRLREPADRGALGRRAARDRAKGGAGLRVAAAEAAWQGPARDKAARLPAARRRR